MNSPETFAELNKKTGNNLVIRMGGYNVDIIMESLPLNSRIRVDTSVGTVKFVGEVTGYNGIWIGVEWDVSDRGKHDGTINGIKYFDTSYIKSGSMIRPEKIAKYENVRDAIENRYYLADDVDPLDEEIFREAQKMSKAKIFEFVGLEKVVSKQSHLELLKELSLPNSNISYAGDLSPLKQLSYLQLSGSLISSWKMIAEITKQLPKLAHLDLTKNRLQYPNEMEIVDLEPAFRNLETINLSENNLEIWDNVVHLAKLWPDIQKLGLRDNGISSVLPFFNQDIFTNLCELDLEGNNICDFQEILKLGNIKSLVDLNLAGNKITAIELPDCIPNERLDIFKGLRKLNIHQNPIKDQLAMFNELDKLPVLDYLLVSRDKSGNFEQLFSNAVSRMSILNVLNKREIKEEERRGAEYDLWKTYGLEWVNGTEADRTSLAKRCRSYPRIIKKYGSPADLIILPQKTSNLITINIQTIGKTIKKRVPKKISVQTLQGIVLKLLNCGQTTLPSLSYVDGTKSNIIVKMDNLSRNLDFYSIQDGDTVVVDW